MNLKDHSGYKENEIYKAPSIQVLSRELVVTYTKATPARTRLELVPFKRLVMLNVGLPQQECRSVSH